MVSFEVNALFPNVPIQNFDLPKRLLIRNNCGNKVIEEFLGPEVCMKQNSF